MSSSFELNPDLKTQNNKITCFFPINTKDRKNKDVFDWQAVLGKFIGHCYQYQLKAEDFDAFQEATKNKFEEKLDDTRFWQVIKNMYFNNDELFNVSPKFLAFKAQKQPGKPANQRLTALFESLLQNTRLPKTNDNNLNFIEKEFVDTFEEHVFTSKVASSLNTNQHCYLPFLAEHFQADLRFISSKPKYFLSTITDFLRLYAFLYTAQLAINIAEWKQGKPTAKPCYFIMDNERASEERTTIKDFGYNQLKGHFAKIFPYLAIVESLQKPKSAKVPIWDIPNQLEAIDCLDALNNYIKDFINDRKLDIDIEPVATKTAALEKLLAISLAQFGIGQTRVEINKHYCDVTEAELCGHFIQNRKRAGKVLAFNQDYILLLTNLVIAEKEQLRLHELLEGFKSRGVFFDNQSQNSLVEFYERIGNVERKSDSGDAVYVKKTV